ncbi:hypothetical protein [Flagellimonas eckloniae]|uniref:Lipoprotein n=1 Tax=Flagellimonas eckloniae TaxID=346185 RepID=A0A0Q1BW62_9FLAO|nr:hypothetical protein [Allomuricauda eckloniae]KQC28777.1 hypothetical protein AAY42_01870 [Allomuricauda eckloniae]
MKRIAYLSISIILFLVLACSEDSLEPFLADEDTNEESQEDTNPDPEDPSDNSFVTDSFDGTGPLVDFVINNEAALPEVTRENGRYRAELTDNSDNKTLHFNDDQGRLDAKLVTFPFEFIARNIGIGTLDDSQTAPTPSGSLYIFSGVQVHVEDLDSFNSAHVVVGHRGNTHFTIEGKNTVNGDSSVNDIGANTVPNGRADIRIVGNEDQTITVYWQVPNLDYETTDDNWTAYNETGNLPGIAPTFGNNVYVGLITYAFGTNGVPFVGTCDAIQVSE